ncbi:hypothetical protein [Streptomyces sp. AA1529]|uniref:hypothetical protein n=1 Tax=Streptomyces sp. AA1529 TaxID=1203257 RepID=UPI003D75FECD
MARQRGGDNAHRKRRQQGAKRHREIYVFAEGEVTEDEYTQIVLDGAGAAVVLLALRGHQDWPDAMRQAFLRRCSSTNLSTS